MKSNRARFGGFLFGNRSAAITLRRETGTRTDVADLLPALPAHDGHGRREATAKRRPYMHRLPQIDPND